MNQEKKEEIWFNPMTIAPTPAEMSKGQSDNTNNATKKFGYTAVSDRLRTVSWSNYGHPTGVVNLVYGPNFPTPRNSHVIKRIHLIIRRYPQIFADIFYSINVFLIAINILVSVVNDSQVCCRDNHK